jgi:hypothetical protein
MLKDITNSVNSPRYSGTIDSPSKLSRSKKFNFEQKTIEDEINEINAIIRRKNNPQNAYMDLSYTVYHLYENGAITSQKGGIDYLKKDEFILKPKILNIELFKFSFPMFDSTSGLTYTVVNENDANITRAQMREIILRGQNHNQTI